MEYVPEQPGHFTTASGHVPSGTRTCFWHFGQLVMNAIDSTPLGPSTINLVYLESAANATRRAKKGHFHVTSKNSTFPGPPPSGERV